MSEIPPINRSFQFPTETSDSQENKNSKAANNDASDAIEKSSDQVNFEAVLAGSNVDTSTDAEIQRLNDLRNSLDTVMHDGAASLKEFEEKLNEVGDDAQLANVDLQNILQKQQQTLQMISNISKMIYDTAMSIIRKVGR